MINARLSARRYSSKPPPRAAWCVEGVMVRKAVSGFLIAGADDQDAQRVAGSQRRRAAADLCCRGIDVAKQAGEYEYQKLAC